jgi:hypothetical protein
VPVITASVTSFSLATAANYLLSVILAFQRGRFRRSIEALGFLTVVLVGLGFNTLLVSCFVYRFSIHPAAAKIVAVSVVLIWNYLGRRLFVFSDNIPVAVGAWLKPRETVLTLVATAKHSAPMGKGCARIDIEAISFDAHAGAGDKEQSVSRLALT